MTARPPARRPRRHGAPAAMNKDRVVAAALAIIDRDGVEAFSIRHLAQALGVYPTAVYWYVPSRNALLAEVVSRALADVVPPGEIGDWRDWLKDLFRRYRASVRRHPNVAPLIGARLVSNAGADPELVDRILAALSAAGFAGDALVHAYNTVVAAMVGFVTLELAPMPVEDADTWSAELRKTFRDADAGRYPALAGNLPRLENRAFIVRWQNGTAVPLDDSFEMFIDVAVRGLERRLGGA